MVGKREDNMSTEINIDVRRENTEIKLHPQMAYTPAILEIRGETVKFEILAENEQLAELEYAIRQHLERERYYETPDQQTILNEEHNQLIEEEAA